MVESFFSVVKLHVLEVDDDGKPHFRIVSPMGRSLSNQQLQKLVDANESRVILLFDGDDPGRAAVTTVGRQLLEAGLEVTAPVVPERFKPHRTEISQLLDLIK
jgi:DNA primase